MGAFSSTRQSIHICFYLFSSVSSCLFHVCLLEGENCGSVFLKHLFFYIIHTCRAYILFLLIVKGCSPLIINNYYASMPS